jgi:hypothetical protein
MLTIDTLGKLLDVGYRLECYCNNCGGVGQGAADLPSLISKLGRDFNFIGESLKPHLPCPDCLSNMEFRLHAPAGGVGGAHRR